MAIQTVRAQINGTWHTLTYNDDNGRVEATNMAGTQATADGSTIPGLQLVVRETVAPVITIVSPVISVQITG